jgi:hypothetical protein
MKNEVYNYNIEKLIIETCRLIRQGYEAESNSYLVLLTRRLLESTEKLTPKKLSELTPILKIMLDAQQRKDMAYVADILQYEIILFVGNE